METLPYEATHITTEASWLGDISTNPAHRLPTNMSNYYAYYIIDKDVLAKLDTCVTSPFAVANNKKEILFFAGTDKNGREQRIYDIEIMYPPSRPDDNRMETFAPEYVDILYRRAESAINYNTNDDTITQIPISVRMTDMELARQFVQQRKQQAEKIRNWTLSKLIPYMNRYFGYVRQNTSIIASKSVTLKRKKGWEYVKVTFELQGKQAFIESYNVRIPGDTQRVTNVWFDHKDRATYTGIDFSKTIDKNRLNYWHGLRPIPPGTNPERALILLRHIYFVICNEDDVIFEYYLCLLAYKVQHPMEKTNVFAVLDGIQGGGKSIIYDCFMGRILGDYYINCSVEDLKSFSGFLGRCLLCHVEEKTALTDPSMIAKFKKMVTCDEFMLEEKFMPKVMVENYVNFVATTNEANCAEMENDNRRIFAIKINDSRAAKTLENKAYFDEIMSVKPEELQAFLMNFPLGDFDPRQIPMTRLMREQKLANLPTSLQWWYECLVNAEGEIFPGKPLRVKEDVYKEYCEWLRIEYRSKHPLDNKDFWSHIRAAIGTLWEQHRGGIPSRRTYLWGIPRVEDAKRAFCEYVKDENYFVISLL